MNYSFLLLCFTYYIYKTTINNNNAIALHDIKVLKYFTKTSIQTFIFCVISKIN